MDIEFLPNNAHLQAPDQFAELDPHLRRMLEQPYVYHSSLIDQLPKNVAGIYNLGGGRQVGKTTMLKQWILELLKQGIDPNAICFFSCELIVDEQSLYRIVMNQLKEMPKTSMRYLILDEITYVRGWDKAIKYLADTGAFDQVVVVISGSDLVIMQDARKTFPGRRGKSDVVDFHYYPLSFREFLQLKKKIKNDVDLSGHPSLQMISMFYEEFQQYLMHGGFLTAINEFAATKTLSEYTLATYSDWIRGDIIKKNKKEHYLREILSAILKHYSSQISWRELVKALTIDHTQTAIDYVNLLESMDAVFVQAAIIEDKLAAAPKKHRKFMFTDPFIYHAINAWLNPVKNVFKQQIQFSVNDPEQSSLLVEACVTSHVRRHYEKTFYIKADNEVDIAYVHEDRFWPVEIKWTHQLRPASLKQILKYQNGEIWAQVNSKTLIGKTPILPLPWALLRF